jgi:hypothetical protein
MVQLQDFISKHLHHHTLFNMPFDRISKAHHAQILSYSSPWVSVWFTTQLIFLTFQLVSPIFSIVLWTQLGLPHPSIATLMRVHTSHQLYGYPPLTLCSWQWVHKNPLCSLWHLYYHCMGCWLPDGAKITTCTSFKHVQSLLLMSQHYVHQDGIRILVNIVIAIQCEQIYFPNLTPLKDLLLPMWFKSKNGGIVTNASLINSSS